MQTLQYIVQNRKWTYASTKYLMIGLKSYILKTENGLNMYLKADPKL